MRGIYWIRNRINGKFYVGSSKDIEKRFQQHRSHLNKGVHANRHLQGAWKQYGETAFNFEVLEECSCDADELLEIEQWYLENSRCCDEKFGYNIDTCANCQRGRHNRNFGKRRSEETKVKLRAANIGKKASCDTRMKMSASRMKRIGLDSPYRKSIQQLDMVGNVIREWNSGKDAARELGILASGISVSARGERLTAEGRQIAAGGFLWRFK